MACVAVFWAEGACMVPAVETFEGTCNVALPVCDCFRVQEDEVCALLCM
jgi:hypothetical protein